MIQKARMIPADVLIFDLEDAVAPAAKETARRIVAEALRDTWPQTVYVRTNPIDSATILDEVMELSGASLTGFVLPKVESAGALQGFLYLLDRLEQKLRLQPGHLKVLPIIETASGLRNVQDISSASARICCLAFGAIDFALDLGVQSLPPQLLDYIRCTMVIASRSAGIGAPVDSVYPDFHDSEGLLQSASQAKGAGFAGKFAIHPDQVSILNKVFSTGEVEFNQAQEIVRAYEEAMASGQGSIQVNGKMVDLPVYELAKRVLGR
ncbi:CoA ester lyase [Alicyclobacillus cycloheptanicus]|uniref:Citrate lyase subunit beta/citryl-CoA lyase n=2 Tax=Alicyclobacillus cycloheptanicus TaxID=1457 RepID=A0ABT9XGU8_9BACL|nr:CoA ester lyase [Alicyclobacillus cycloheptanicus]MDQ0189535.1 citrate lyase subunit beta/citryl-CoA lyase [Alicyclobacillus cycloheptanicus]WDM01590.1 CoA ester lyase [Alicyclobacillus cycloheptanicus]